MGKRRKGKATWSSIPVSQQRANCNTATKAGELCKKEEWKEGRKKENLPVAHNDRRLFLQANKHPVHAVECDQEHRCGITLTIGLMLFVPRHSLLYFLFHILEFKQPWIEHVWKIPSVLNVSRPFLFVILF